MDGSDQLIGLIYETCHDQNIWKDFCEALRRRFGGSHIAMHGHDSITGNTLGFLNTSYDDFHLAQYKAYYGSINPWAIKARELPSGVVHRSEEMLPHEDLLRTECYNEWIRPQDNIATGAGVTLLKSDNLFFRLSCNIRLKDREKLQDELVATLTTLAPHMQNAIAISRRFAGIPLSSEVESTLNSHSSAIFLLTKDCRVVFQNAKAAHFLKSAKGFRLLANGEIALDDTAAATAIHRACHDITTAKPSFDAAGKRFSIKTEKQELLATAIPFNASGRYSFGFLDVVLRDSPSVMLMIEFDNERDDGIRESLKRNFSLTPAEIELAIAIGKGETVTVFADRNAKALNTVRTQLKSVFSKMKVARQAELASYLSRLD